MIFCFAENTEKGKLRMSNNLCHTPICCIILFFSFLSCSKDATSPSPNIPEIEIVNLEDGFIWGDSIEVQVSISNDDNFEMMKLLIDNEIDSTIIFEDYIYPFNFIWHTKGQRFGKYYVQARMYRADKTSISSEIITLTLSPCPIFKEDFQNYEGITETDAKGPNTIGNVDVSDWNYSNLNFSFGPSYPNPCKGTCTIPFTLSQSSEISIVIVDKNAELIDVIFNEWAPAGQHIINWKAPENTHKLYRCIFHESNINHWTGDISVE
jgi:hypothetical protein